jgi:hypothetical protein
MPRTCTYITQLLDGSVGSRLRATLGRSGRIRSALVYLNILLERSSPHLPVPIKRVFTWTFAP